MEPNANWMTVSSPSRAIPGVAAVTVIRCGPAAPSPTKGGLTVRWKAGSTESLSVIHRVAGDTW